MSIKDEHIIAKLKEIESEYIELDQKKKDLDRFQEEIQIKKRQLEDELEINIIKKRKMSEIDSRIRDVQDKIDELKALSLPMIAEIDRINNEIKKHNRKISEIEKDKCAVVGHNLIPDSYMGGKYTMCSRCGA